MTNPAARDVEHSSLSGFPALGWSVARSPDIAPNSLVLSGPTVDDRYWRGAEPEFLAVQTEQYRLNEPAVSATERSWTQSADAA